MNAAAHLIGDDLSKTPGWHSDKWSGIALAPNGKLYCSPFTASKVLRINPATDTTELLGCFEQSEPSRLIHAALRAVGEMSADASLSLLTIGQRYREADEAFARRRTEAVQLATEVQRADAALGDGWRRAAEAAQQAAAA